MNEHLIQINDTLSEVNLEVMYSPIGMFRWQIQLAMEQVRSGAGYNMTHSNSQLVQ
jgi:hypothetical protein